MPESAPDWTGWQQEEPGTPPPGTTKSSFDEGIGAAVKGAAKGAVRAGEIAFTPHTQKVEPFKSVFEWAREPGKSLPEQTGIGVGEVGPFFLNPLRSAKVGIEEAATQWAARKGARQMGQMGPSISPALGEVVKFGGKVAEGAGQGAIGGAVSPADSAEERAKNAAWGAAVGGVLKGIGGTGDLVNTVPPETRTKIAKGFTALVGSALGAYQGGPIGALYGLGGAGAAQKFFQVGEIMADLLPWALRQANKVPGVAAGAATGMAREQPKAPDFEGYKQE